MAIPDEAYTAGLRRLEQELADGSAPRLGDRVVDVACGTGVVAIAAARRVGPTGRVIGVDLNPGMLVMARAQSAPSPECAPIEWHEASADALPWPTDPAISSTASSGFNIFRTDSRP